MKKFHPIWLLFIGVAVLQVLSTGLKAPRSPLRSPPQQPRIDTTGIPSAPTSGSGVPVTIGNASPKVMQLLLESSTGRYLVQIAPCPICVVYANTPPEGCPPDTVWQTFILPPTVYQVQVIDDVGSTYSSPLDLTRERSYRACFHSTYSREHRPLQ